jgi:hypothetical protein
LKNIVLVCTVILAVIWSVAAGAAPGNGCPQIVQKLNGVHSAIAEDSNAYWAHRANFVDLRFGGSRLVVPGASAVPNALVAPNALQAADQEKGQADAVKAGMPNRLASLKGLLTAAQAQDCLSPAQLSGIAEPTIKQGKRVNFDQFPLELPLESSVVRGPPEMPKN